MTKRKKTDGKIDIRAALEAPVKLNQGGHAKSMPPYEATLRQHVKKALIDRSLPSIKFVIGEAEKYDVIKRPPPPNRGGVFFVPKWLPEEAQKEIFDDQPEAGRQDPMSRICGIINTWIKVFKAKAKEREQEPNVK